MNLSLKFENLFIFVVSISSTCGRDFLIKDLMLTIIIQYMVEYSAETTKEKFNVVKQNIILMLENINKASRLSRNLMESFGSLLWFMLLFLRLFHNQPISFTISLLHFYRSRCLDVVSRIKRKLLIFICQAKYPSNFNKSKCRRIKLP